MPFAATLRTESKDRKIDRGVCVYVWSAEWRRSLRLRNHDRSGKATRTEAVGVQPIFLDALSYTCILFSALLPLLCSSKTTPGRAVRAPIHAFAAYSSHSLTLDLSITVCLYVCVCVCMRFRCSCPLALTSLGSLAVLRLLSFLYPFFPSLLPPPPSPPHIHSLPFFLLLFTFSLAFPSCPYLPRVQASSPVF